MDHEKDDRDLLIQVVVTLLKVKAAPKNSRRSDLRELSWRRFRGDGNFNRT